MKSWPQRDKSSKIVEGRASGLALCFGNLLKQTLDALRAVLVPESVDDTASGVI